MLAQLERLGDVLSGTLWFRQNGVIVAHCEIPHGKVRIEFDGTLMVWQGVSTVLIGFFTKAVRFQGFKRGRGCLGQRHIELLYGSQRFAQLSAQLRRYLA